MTLIRTPFRRLAAAAAVFLLQVAPVLAQPLTAEARKDILDKASDLIEHRAFVPGVDFTKWPQVLEKHHEAIDKAEEVRAFERAMDNAFKDFGVSHLTLVTPRQAETRRTGTTVGVGVSVDPSPEGLRVLRVLEESPAAQAGVQVGEVIVQVDGKPADRSMLAGEDGAEISLTLRDEAGQTRDITLARRKLSTRRPETLTKLADDASMIVIPTFANGYNRENIEKLFTEAASSKYLVIDLRSNGGGLVRNLNHFLGFLLVKDTAIGVSISRTLAERYAEMTGGDPTDAAAIAAWAERKTTIRENPIDPFPGRVAVLINRGSASASEIAGAALRDLKSALLVGQPSAGKVLVSSYLRLPESFEIKVPLSDYVTIKGQRLEGHPLKPDLEASGRPGERAAADIALERLRALDKETASDEPK